MAGSSEKMGWSSIGGTCGGLLSISTTTTLAQATITSHLDNCQSLSAVCPASTLAPLQPILPTEVRIRIKVNHVILLTCGFPFLLSLKKKSLSWLQSLVWSAPLPVPGSLSLCMCQSHWPLEFQPSGSSCHRALAHAFFLALCMILFHPLFPKLTLAHP